MILNVKVLKALCLVIFCKLVLLVSPVVTAANSDPLNNLVKAKPASSPVQSSPLFSGRGDGITTCPVTGEKIMSKNIKAEMHGRTVYFCCHGCLKAAMKIPDKFVKPTFAEQQHAVKAFLVKASQESNGEEFCNE
jgi:hypothetical protein